MKKLFIIAMCLVSLGLASCNKEKANEQFIGNYEGTLMGETLVSFNIPGMPAQEPMSLGEMELPVTIQMVAGDKDNEVIASYIDETGTAYSMKGIIDGNFVDFEPYTVTAPIEEYGSEMEVTLDLEGTLEGNNLNTVGKVTANGSINEPEIFPMPIPVVINVDVNGVLVKAAR